VPQRAAGAKSRRQPTHGSEKLLAVASPQHVFPGAGRLRERCPRSAPTDRHPAPWLRVHVRTPGVRGVSAYADARGSGAIPARMRIEPRERGRKPSWRCSREMGCWRRAAARAGRATAPSGSGRRDECLTKRMVEPFSRFPGYRLTGRNPGTTGRRAAVCGRRAVWTAIRAVALWRKRDRLRPALVRAVRQAFRPHSHTQISGPPRKRWFA
jgi:hypothetical protein